LGQFDSGGPDSTTRALRLLPFPSGMSERDLTPAGQSARTEARGLYRRWWRRCSGKTGTPSKSFGNLLLSHRKPSKPSALSPRRTRGTLGKLARAQASAPELEAGNYWLPQPQWAEEFIEECVGPSQTRPMMTRWMRGVKRHPDSGLIHQESQTTTAKRLTLSHHWHLGQLDKRATLGGNIWRVRLVGRMIP
jgi:hypothetical protein